MSLVEPAPQELRDKQAHQPAEGLEKHSQPKDVGKKPRDDHQNAREDDGQKVSELPPGIGPFGQPRLQAHQCAPGGAQYKGKGN